MRLSSCALRACSILGPVIGLAGPAWAQSANAPPAGTEARPAEGQQAPAVTSVPVSGAAAVNTGQAMTPAAEVPVQDEGYPDIVVNARRRSESAMRTPVVLSVVTAEQLRDLNITRMDDLGEVVPGLRIQRGIGGAVGTVVTVRGIGSGTSAQYIDQSVGLAVDEVGYSHGSFYDAAAFDLAQAELLKGPQGLFFGKSTTAGIVSFTTADPTRDWTAEAGAGYEFNADEVLLNGFVSGPISDTLGIRVAGYYRAIEGYLRNSNPGAPPQQRRLPDGDDFGGRLTLKFDAPAGNFRARFKLAGTRLSSNADQQAMRQFVSCTNGSRPQNPFFRFDNCRLDDFNIGTGSFPLFDPNIDFIRSAGNVAAFQAASPFPETRNGAGYLRQSTVLSSLNLAYDMADRLTLSAIVGYGHVATDAQQEGFIAALGRYQLVNIWREDNYSAEIRLTSSWEDSWINFMVGGLYNEGESNNVFGVALPAVARFVRNTQVRETRTASAFGQVLLTPIERVELSAGLRYTHIRQAFPFLSALSNVVGFRPGDANDASGNQAPLLPRSVTRDEEDNASPEFTVTYRPTDTVTTFASYKWGFKGPGYNATGFLITSYLTPNAISSFGGERVRGGEVGVKAQLAERRVNLTAAIYDYKYLGLQVSHYDGARGVITVSNGADARTRGIELGVSARPAVLPGFEANGFLAYNDAKYTDFPTSPCYGGQTVAMGCVPIRTGVSVQDLTGRRLAYAPRWVGNVGASYEFAVTPSLGVAVGGAVNFSSNYNYTPALHPRGFQDRWATIDGYVKLLGNDEAWDMALIGRNLTDKRYVVTGFDAGAFTPGVLSDTQGIPNRSRQVLLQLTVRPWR